MSRKTLFRPARRKDNQGRQYRDYEDGKPTKTTGGISELRKGYQLFYGKLPDLLCTIDNNGIIRDCNRTYAETFGCPKEELVGGSVFDFVDGEGERYLRNSFKNKHEAGHARNKQVWFKKGDGTKFPGLVSTVDFENEDGDIVGINIIIKDITGIHLSGAQENETCLQHQLDELKKTNIDLASTQQKYKDLYEKAPALLRTINMEGILTDCNDAYAKALGYAREEAVGMSFYDHTAERSVTDLKKNFEEWGRGKQITQQEIWMKRKDGSTFPALLSGTSVHDANGKLIGRWVALTDMSRMYEINNLLAKSEQKYKDLYEKTPTLLRTITTDGNFTDCNDAYAKALGYTKDEILGMSIYEHTATRSIQDMKDNFETWLKTRDTPTTEIWLKRKDGSIFPTLLGGTSLYDDNGKLIGRTLGLTDMSKVYDARTKLEESQQQLQDQIKQLEKTNIRLSSTEEKYRSLYQKAPVLLRTITNDGIITDCNDAYAKALGYAREEAVGMSFYDHTAERSVTDLKDNFNTWESTQNITHQEIWMKRKDGSIFPALISGASIIDEYGNITGRTVALTDMTEVYDIRKKLENDEAQIRKQYEELKKLDVAKEEFASMISHELKTPLTPILGWCQALVNPKIMGEMSQKQVQAVEVIRSNASKLKDLVGDMLDAQKLDMKRMRFEFKYVDITAMMNSQVKNLQNMMEPKNIDFVNSTNHDIVIKTDRVRLEQVLTNIIINAVDFVPNKGGRIEISAENQNGNVLFSIKDNGIGIPKDKQKNLFKHFYQIDTSATRKHGGSGLGLAICKGIVEGLGGEIWLESDTDKGAIFYFTIKSKTDAQES